MDGKRPLAKQRVLVVPRDHGTPVRENKTCSLDAEDDGAGSTARYGAREGDVSF
jgi:hypothetical protein